MVEFNVPEAPKNSQKKNIIKQHKKALNIKAHKKVNWSRNDEASMQSYIERDLLNLLHAAQEAFGMEIVSVSDFLAFSIEMHAELWLFVVSFGHGHFCWNLIGDSSSFALQLFM